jgi:hypothetical protein
MPQFMLTYHMTKQPESPEAAQQGKKDWNAWKETHKDKLVVAEHFFTDKQTVTEEGISEGAQHLGMGYSILEATSLEEALELTKTNPFLPMGTIELAEIKSM